MNDNEFYYVRMAITLCVDNKVAAQTLFRETNSHRGESIDFFRNKIHQGAHFDCFLDLNRLIQSLDTTQELRRWNGDRQKEISAHDHKIIDLESFKTTAELQINELIAHNERLVSQNNAQRTELDDARIQLDKKTEEFNAFKSQFDVLKNMICESGAFNCDVMFGALPPEPEL